MLADLVRGDHERLVLDRSRAQQRLPVVARRRERERGRQRERASAAHSEDPVELREAHVVANREAELQAIRGLRENDLIAGVLQVRLAIRAPGDFDVEHVQLAIDGLDLAVRIDVHARVRELLLAVDALDDRAGDELDAEFLRRLARPADGWAVERLGGGAKLLIGTHRRPLLREYDHACAVAGCRPCQAVCDSEICRRVGGGVELNCGNPQDRIPSRGPAPTIRPDVTGK